MQELSLNILDVAQNSVTAGAGLVQILLSKDEKGWLQITIADNGCGMTPEQLRQVEDPFFTTRTTRKVGLGVPLFKMAAEQTGGRLEITSAPGVGTTTTAWFDTAHIDCMPMGDICATICSLIQCNPGIDFLYRYTTPKGSMEADTRQFRQVLEDMPLNTPEVMAFIREFITENSAGLE